MLSHEVKRIRCIKKFSANVCTSDSVLFGATEKHLLCTARSSDRKEKKMLCGLDGRNDNLS